MNDITQWLKNKDYDKGVMLYEKYGTSPSLKRILKKSGSTKKNKATLEYELSKILARNEAKKVRKITKKKKKKAKTLHVKQNQYKEPEKSAIKRLKRYLNTIKSPKWIKNILKK